MAKSFRKMNLRHELVQIIDLCGPKGMTVEVLLRNTGSRGHALVVLLLSIPFVLPVPLPGLSTPFGIVVALLGLAIAFQRQPYLPVKIRNLIIPETVLRSTVGRFNSALDKVDWLIGPRLSLVVDSLRARRIHGLLIFFAAILLALPAPPGGNVGPALASILFSLAILEEDGVLTILGVVALLISTAVMAGIWFALIEGVQKLIF